MINKSKKSKKIIFLSFTFLFLLFSCGNDTSSLTTSNSTNTNSQINTTTSLTTSTTSNTTSQTSQIIVNDEVENQIFISELYKGSKVYDVAIEIANTSNSVIDLSNYKLEIIKSMEVENSLDLQGFLNNNEVFVIANNSFIAKNKVNVNLQLTNDILNKNRCYRIINKQTNELVDILGNERFYDKQFLYGNPIRNEESLYSITKFDYMNYYCLSEGVADYLGNLDLPLSKNELLEGPKLEEKYANLSFSDGLNSLGGFFETTIESLGDGDTTYFYYPSEANLDSGSGSYSTRYLFINTPEVDHGGELDYIKAEPWGYAAKDYNNQKLRNATSIIVQSCIGSPVHETFGRVLGLVWYSDKVNPSLEDYRLLNYETIRDGYAFKSGTEVYNEMNYKGINYSFFVDYALRIAEEKGIKVHGEVDPNFDYNN